MKLETSQRLSQAASSKASLDFNYRGPGQNLKSFGAQNPCTGSRRMINMLTGDLNLEKVFVLK